MKMALRILVLLVLIGGGVVLLVWHQQRTLRLQRSGLQISGTIETTTVQVSFKVPGRVATRPVDEGQTVTAGAAVATLDDDELRAEVAADTAALAAAQAALAELEAGSRAEDIAHAKAVLAAAQARLAELKAGPRPTEIAAAAAALHAATVTRDHLSVELQRTDTLLAGKFVPTADFDTAKAARDASAAQVDQLAAALQLLKDGTRAETLDQQAAAVAQAQAALDLLVAGPRQETIAQQRARVAQAASALALAQTRLTYARIVAPVGGLVLAKHVEPGEYVNPGSPVVTIGDLEHVWLRGYVDETDLGRVKLGQPVVVTCDTFPGKVYHGTVSFLAAEGEFTPKNVQTQKERVKLVYRLKVDIPNPALELKVGMPVDAHLALDASLTPTDAAAPRDPTAGPATP